MCEASFFKKFAPDAENGAIPEQDLYHGSALVEKKQRDVRSGDLCRIIAGHNR